MTKPFTFARKILFTILGPTHGQRSPPCWSPGQALGPQNFWLSRVKKEKDSRIRKGSHQIIYQFVSSRAIYKSNVMLYTGIYRALKNQFPSRWWIAFQIIESGYLIWYIICIYFRSTQRKNEMQNRTVLRCNNQPFRDVINKLVLRYYNLIVLRYTIRSFCEM